jgi:TRAP transporter 4TM/12TM fusion protein
MRSASTREALGQRTLNIVITGVATLMVLYHLVSTQYLLLGPIPFQNLHLAFALVIVFLRALTKRPKIWPLIFPLILVSLAATAYVHIFYYDLELRSGFPTTIDVIVGIILIVVVLESTRQAWGLVLPVLALLFIAYSILGYLLPPPFNVMNLGVEQIVSNLCIGMRGMYGSILSISASYIFLFVVFGTLLNTSGATGFFVEVGKALGRRCRSGPAMSAVVTSSLVGMITGSVVANILTIGPFTIPLMKRIGYKPEQAAAIEAAASTGGQIMPPVMGIAAFAMAVFTETPYIKICAMAALPAIFYYFTCGTYVHLQALKQGVSPVVEETDVPELMKRMPLFVLPLGGLVTLLARGHSADYCVFWAIIALAALSSMRKKTRPSLRNWLKGFAEGAITASEIAVSVACIGFVMGVMVSTGLGIKIASAVEAWSGGYLIVALIITMLVSILLGMGVPTFTSYVFVSIIAGPVLIKMGLSMVTAHLFVFYFACFSFVTPPVAIGALVASRLAQADYTRSGLEACKVAFGGFVIPYVIVFCPAITLQNTDMSFTFIVLGCIALLAGLTALEIGFVGYFLLALPWLIRAGFILLAASFLLFVMSQQFYLFFVGGALSVFLGLWEWRNKRLAGLRIHIKTSPTSL